MQDAQVLGNTEIDVSLVTDCYVVESVVGWSPLASSHNSRMLV
jgi:hypothetical protein